MYFKDYNGFQERMDKINKIREKIRTLNQRTPKQTEDRNLDEILNEVDLDQKNIESKQMNLNEMFEKAANIEEEDNKAINQEPEVYLKQDLNLEYLKKDERLIEHNDSFERKGNQEKSEKEQNLQIECAESVKKKMRAKIERDQLQNEDSKEYEEQIRNYLIRDLIRSEKDRLNRLAETLLKNDKNLRFSRTDQKIEEKFKKERTEYVDE